MDQFRITERDLEEINAFLCDPDNPYIREVMNVVQKYGGPEEINRKAQEAKNLHGIFRKLENMEYPYLKDIRDLIAARDKGAFISISDYRKKILGDDVDKVRFDEKNPVTMEISPLQFYPWFLKEVHQALDKREIMPARYIRLRPMREQERDGDLLAVVATMQIIGASFVEQVETNGTDGSNVHLGNPAETSAGYFGGVGMPNDYPIKWLDETLYYYVNYGVEQFICTNNGVVFIGMLLNRLGIDIQFKISVTLGNDNPYLIFQNLMLARMFSREGKTAIAGLNLSNSVNNQTIRDCAGIRRSLGLENDVRIEHHITEPWKGVVRQPFLRRDQLIEVVDDVPNMSAKHEGGEPDIEVTREHPSCHQDNFRPEEVIRETGDYAHMELSYMDKHDSLNLTAKALVENGKSFIGATNLHRR